jgi:hypothetical protein
MAFKPKLVKVNDKMQKNYSYYRTRPEGDMSDFPEFKPAYSPKQMLQMGIMEGKYFRDCHNEYPADWFVNAKEAKGPNADPSLNYFKIKSRLSLQEWRRRGWVPLNAQDGDIRGQIQWYFRFYSGRRDPNVDAIQIGRWKKFKRHYAQVVKNCKHPKNARGKCSDPMNCRPRARMALLQWAWPCLD